MKKRTACPYWTKRMQRAAATAENLLRAGRVAAGNAMHEAVKAAHAKRKAVLA